MELFIYKGVSLMWFKKSKKKRLMEARRQLFFLREGLQVQREHAVSLAERHIHNPKEYAKSVEQLYTYMIDKLKEIEKELQE
jgi:hypothetical protein